MRLHRFYIDKELSVGANLSVDETSHIHQWLSVFRYTTGDAVVLFNGDGFEYQATFIELHKKKAVVSINEHVSSVIPKKKVHLFLAVIKKDLFELAVEKCTELGVSSITPLLTERTQDKNLNMERLQKVAIEASEQSGRGDVPHINQSVSLQNALESVKGYTIFVGDLNHKGDQEKLKKSSRNDKEPQALFIGPEGGWGSADQELFVTYSVEKVSFGETVLRAETAAIVGSFMLLN